MRNILKILLAFVMLAAAVPAFAQARQIEGPLVVAVGETVTFSSENRAGLNWSFSPSGSFQIIGHSNGESVLARVVSRPRDGRATVRLAGVDFHIDVVEAAAQPPAALPSAQGPRITVVNNTGHLVRHVQIAAPEDDYWGSDMLEANRILPSGREVSFHLPHPMNEADIMLTDSGGNTYIQWDVPIQANSRIVFTFDDLSEGATSPASPPESPMPRVGNALESAVGVRNISNNTGDFMRIYFYSAEIARDFWAVFELAALFDRSVSFVPNDRLSISRAIMPNLNNAALEGMSSSHYFESWMYGSLLGFCSITVDGRIEGALISNR